MSEPRTIATVRSYDDLHLALRERASQLHVSREALDDAAGLPNGYAGKVLGLSKRKVLGLQSLELFLGALGLVLVVVEDPGAERRLSRYEPRDERRACEGPRHWRSHRRAALEAQHGS